MQGREAHARAAFGQERGSRHVLRHSVRGVGRALTSKTSAGTRRRLSVHDEGARGRSGGPSSSASPPSALAFDESSSLESARVRVGRPWLVRSVPNLVKHLKRREVAGKPFALFVCRSSLLGPPISLWYEDEDSFQDWPAVLETARRDGVADEEGFAGFLAVKRLRGESSVSTKAASSTAMCPLLGFAEETSELASGKVGDCCDEEEEEEERKGAAELSDEVRYGVVIQTMRASRSRNAEDEGIDGCYVLSTSTSTSSGCACTHYNMSRAVCNGDGTCMSVAKQIDSAWLANPFLG